MYYLSQSLSFEEDKIYYNDNQGYEHPVMMSWEDPLMSGSAAAVTQNGGDILEIGFGMGMSAGYIQSHSIDSHTIIESHPDVIPKAQAWAADKPNVTIVTGSWYNVVGDLSTYDGIFYDAYGDDDIRQLEVEVPNLMKSGGVFTWWNVRPTSQSIFNFDNVTYEKFNVNPPPNNYYTHSVYYIPTKQF